MHKGCSLVALARLASHDIHTDSLIITQTVKTRIGTGAGCPDRVFA